MRISIAQMRVKAADISHNLKCVKEYILKAQNQGANLVVLPELCLTGYFIGDLWESSAFTSQTQAARNEIVKLSKEIDIVFGDALALENLVGHDGRRLIVNGAFFASQGELVVNPQTKLTCVPKSLLPNYRMFQDSRYFTGAFELSSILNVPLESFYSLLKTRTGNFIALSVCEDAWEEFYPIKPLEFLCSQNNKNAMPDVLVNISASPWALGKAHRRFAQFEKISKKYSIPVVFCNCVGTQNTGKTVFGFDGCSGFINSTVANAPFQESGSPVCLSFFQPELYTFNLFVEKTTEFKQPFLLNEPDSQTQHLQKAIEQILCWVLEEWKINKVVIGASGGIDSALSAVLFSRVLGSENVFLVNMPTKYNSNLTQNAAKKLAQELGTPYFQFPIENLVANTIQELESQNLKLSNLAKENIQARVRSSTCLAGMASALGAVFSCNANKTETTVGYSTLYGDGAGFLAPLADLWKFQIYELARFYNNVVFKKNVIPEDSLNVVPSAELSAEQNVLENKGDPIVYAYHDYLFKYFVENWNRVLPHDIEVLFEKNKLASAIGCEPKLLKDLFASAEEFTADLQKWWNLYVGMAAFKRMQAPPIISVSRRAFGTDFRESVALNSLHYLDNKKSSKDSSL
jgi:NAD+ synthase (glutamine-hydrolysing)